MVLVAEAGRIAGTIAGESLGAVPTIHATLTRNNANGMGGITEGFSAAVGHTPLIRLLALSELTGCEILGKAEFMNPGGSVKDRAALGILQEAEASGLLAPGGTVVEGTAGNTGIGLTHLCNARGYRALIVIPETQSAEKIGLLRSLGRSEEHTSELQVTL